MRTFENVSGLRSFLRTIRSDDKSVGFIPTMGSLHEGHLALITRAKSECDRVIVSIFVNPLQFNDKEDLAAYPRDLKKDMLFLSAENVDALFHPGEEALYPPGSQTFVEVPELSSVLEGSSRPGHFRGVATIVAKLFNIVQPDSAYFGQKDFQQLLVIERMVRDLNLPVSIVSVPTVRDSSGLALSSRNARLSQEELLAATVLIRSLQTAEMFVKAGSTDPSEIKQVMNSIICAEPLAKLDYAELVNPSTLQPVTTLADGVTLAALSVIIGSTRLIDNKLIAPAGVPAVHMPLNKI